MALGIEGRIFFMTLPSPVTIYFRGGIGIKFQIDIVLAPIRIAIYVEVCVICGVKPFDLVYCCAGRELWSASFPKQDYVKTLLAFELPPPDWTSPIKGDIKVSQENGKLLVEWRGFLEEESEIKQFHVIIQEVRGSSEQLHVVGGDDASEWAGRLADYPGAPRVGQQIKVCIKAENTGGRTSTRCTESRDQEETLPLIFDDAPPIISNLMLRDTLTGGWAQPCCAANDPDCGAYDCEQELATNASAPEFMVRFKEFPFPSQNHNDSSDISSVQWTVRNFKISWIDEYFTDLGFKNDTLVARRGMPDLETPWIYINSEIILYGYNCDNCDGLHYLTFYVCDTLSNCKFYYSSPIHVDRTPPTTPGIVPDYHNFTQTCCFTDRRLATPGWGVDEFRTRYEETPDPHTSTVTWFRIHRLYETNNESLIELESEQGVTYRRVPQHDWILAGTQTEFDIVPSPETGKCCIWTNFRYVEGSGDGKISTARSILYPVLGAK